MNRKSKCSLDQLRQQAADGATVSQAAKSLGVTITTVMRRASPAGIIFPTKAEACKRTWAGPTQRKSKCSLDQLRQQAAVGATVSQAAKALGVTITTVIRRASPAGIIFPTRAEARKRAWASGGKGHQQEGHQQ